jgi:hypothetical protein
MPNWTNYLRVGLRNPPHVTLRKAIRLGRRLINQRAARRLDLQSSTFLGLRQEEPLRRRIYLKADELSSDYASFLASATDNYLAHRFDLLGSGWLEVRHGMSCPGLAGYKYPADLAVEADSEGRWLAGRINSANLSESQRIWRLIHQPYVPIDWQLDFKSGYRWSELTYFADLRYGDHLGADVKVPWELARMQHLPQLALAYAAAKDGVAGFPPGETCVEAFRNQVLDFIATNPPRFGVNWACAMDVAIRLVNVVLALDLFLDAEATIDAEFLDLVRRSVVEHARHVMGNLEWAEQGRGNHYLANIIGVLFAAAYLPRSSETEAWLAFASRELIAQATEQFLPDGGNIEGSIAYHRLSSELVLFGLALLLGFDADEMKAASPLPHALFTRLAAAAWLNRHATKPNGAITQWGDNDSGRLVKLQPAWRDDDAALVENVLDQRSFVAATAAITGCDDLALWAGNWAERAVTSALARCRVVPVTWMPADAPDVCEVKLEDVLAIIKALPAESRRVTELPLEPTALLEVSRAAYPDFGHYVIFGSRFYLAIRCPRRTFGAAPGHFHDDMLAVDLQVDGRNLLADPGTFVYTPLPAERNRYRAAEAHSVPRPATGTHADLSRGLFEIFGIPGGRCLFFGARGFAGEANGPGWRALRVVVCGPDSVIIADGCPTGPLAPLVASEKLPRYCNGYGRQTPHSPRSF